MPEVGSPWFWALVSTIAAMVGTLSAVTGYLISRYVRGIDSRLDGRRDDFKHLENTIREQTTHLDERIDETMSYASDVHEESKERDQQIREWARGRFVSVELFGTMKNSIDSLRGDIRDLRKVMLHENE